MSQTVLQIAQFLSVYFMVWAVANEQVAFLQQPMPIMADHGSSQLVSFKL